MSGGIALSKLTKIIGKFGEKDRKYSTTFSK